MPIQISLDRTNESDEHRHYSLTGIADGTSVEVCCRRNVLPLGRSEQRQHGDWNLWWVHRGGGTQNEGRQAIEELIRHGI